MDDVSVKLYSYMCDEVVGSEKVVNNRRQFFNVFDDICTYHADEIHFISSGSKAEGLNLPGSDFDLMMISTHIGVYEPEDVLSNYHDLKTGFNLVLDFDNAMAGFTLLRIYDLREWNKKVIDIYQDGSFLSNRSWKGLFKLGNNVINGPCFTDKLGMRDILCGLRYTKWPSVGRQWIDRPRFYGWPSESLINKIVQAGVLLAPIGSKSDSQKDNPYEWRISFSVAEKMLIYSWNHSQIICYVLLKLLLKEVIQKNGNVDKLFCSYFLKTVIFWLSEELEQNVWTPNNLLNCFMLCLKRLIYWITCRYLPNYFIPEHNMIDRRLPGQSRDELLSIFHSLYDMGWGCIMLCDSLRNFSYSALSLNLRAFPTIGIEFEKAVFPLLHNLQHCILDEYKLHGCMRRCCIMIKNRKLHVNTRRLYFIAFLYLNSDVTRILFVKVFKSNKQNYFQTKQMLSHCMIDTKTSALSGWVVLGLYFYLNKRYHTAIHVLEYAKSLTSLGQFPVSIYCQISIRDMLSKTNREYGILNIFQKIKLKTAKIIHLSIKTDQSFITDEILQLYPDDSPSFCHPEVLLYYLMFCSYHRLNDISRRQDCLHDLVWYVTTESTNRCSPALQLSSYRYLKRAFQIISDTDAANKCTIIIRTLTNLFNVYFLPSIK